MKGKDTCNFLVFLPKTDLFKLFCDVSGKKALARFRWICKSVIFCIYYESNLHDKKTAIWKKKPITYRAQDVSWTCVRHSEDVLVVFLTSFVLLSTN